MSLRRPLQILGDLIERSLLVVDGLALTNSSVFFSMKHSHLSTDPVCIAKLRSRSLGLIHLLLVGDSVADTSLSPCRCLIISILMSGISILMAHLLRATFPQDRPECQGMIIHAFWTPCAAFLKRQQILLGQLRLIRHLIRANIIIRCALISATYDLDIQ